VPQAKAATPPRSRVTMHRASRETHAGTCAWPRLAWNSPPRNPTISCASPAGHD
jgi:hypothetical protein